MGACDAEPGRGIPFNPFQRLMRQWGRIHPYNAGQLLKLAGPADVERISKAWQTTLGVVGLGRLRVEGSELWHSAPERAEDCAVTVLQRGADLCEHISLELNRRFEDGQSPLRPYILDGGDHHYVGVAYHHWIADSVSIRMLLREWFYQMYAPSRARTGPFGQAVEGYWASFGPDRANWRVLEGILSFLRWTARNERVARIEHPGHRNYSVRFSLHEVGHELVGPLLKLSRAHDATLNDLFVTILGEACLRFAPIRQTAQRTDLALGTIVDLRSYSKQDLSDQFGLMLGFTSTLVRPGDWGDFSKLLRTVAAQSRHQKATGVPLFSPVRMLAGLAIGKLVSTKKLASIYRTRLPMAGGISNVNLDRSWAAEFCPSPLLDYIRVSPTGPLMPLVFTPTTLGGKLHFGLTYRPAMIPAERAAEMSAYFIRRLRELAAV